MASAFVKSRILLAKGFRADVAVLAEAGRIAAIAMEPAQLFPVSA